jgi:hypothetical protein
VEIAEGEEGKGIGRFCGIGCDCEGEAAAVRWERTWRLMAVGGGGGGRVGRRGGRGGVHDPREGYG